MNVDSFDVDSADVDSVDVDSVNANIVKCVDIVNVDIANCCRTWIKIPTINNSRTNLSLKGNDTK